MALSMLVKGITANDVSTTPGVAATKFQLNLDGQQVTQKLGQARFGQPKFSRESIAEFQLVTHLFDITQGRSTGIQVQAMSRSGTNDLGGTAFGYFRDDRSTPPTSSPTASCRMRISRWAASIGGPIIRDKLHYFASYELEREPNRPHHADVAPRAEVLVPHRAMYNSFLARGDYQLDAKGHFSVAGLVLGLGEPVRARARHRASVVGGRSDAGFDQRARHLVAGAGRTTCCRKSASATTVPSPKNLPPSSTALRTMVFPASHVGPATNQPNIFYQDTYSFARRPDLAVRQP